ncbi:MAG: ATP-binding protein [Pseudomonadota bacterium]
MVDHDARQIRDVETSAKPVSEDERSQLARVFHQLAAEAQQVLANTSVAPPLILLVVLVVITFLGLIAPWVAVVMFALFTAGFRWHVWIVERERLAKIATPLEQSDQHASAEAAETRATPAEPGWQTILDGLPDPALVLDHEGFILHYNPLLADLFPRVRLGQPLSHLTRSPELLSVLEEPAEMHQRRIIHLEDRVPVHRSLSALLSFLPDEGADAPRSMIVFRDLTDQQKHAQLRADFISHASHELRTPLASLKSMVETLQGPARNDPSAQEKFLAMMQSQAARMTRLIDDLLSLSRAEMRVHVAPTGRVDLNELVLYVAEALEPMAQSFETMISVRTVDTPAWVRGDRDDLVQVFQNLLQNALKYGKEGGQVRIEMGRRTRVGERTEQLAVTIIDDGPGIPLEHIPRLTERFYRVSASDSREKGGTGLGLAIVKYIVNRHRGELKITSKPGEGSQFTVLLEAARSKPAVHRS